MVTRLHMMNGQPVKLRLPLKKLIKIVKYVDSRTRYNGMPGRYLPHFRQYVG